MMPKHLRMEAEGLLNDIRPQTLDRYRAELAEAGKLLRGRVLDLIRYYISRPDCARMEIPQMRFVKNMMMARHWGNPDC